MKDIFIKFINEEFENWLAKQPIDVEYSNRTQVDTPEAEVVVPPRTDGKRAVSSKGTGDRVYLLDDNAKTKAWITSLEVLAGLGFDRANVEDIEDSVLIEYSMAASIYQVK